MVISVIKRRNGTKESVELIEGLRSLGYRMPVLIFSSEYAATTASRRRIAQAGAHLCTSDPESLIRYVRRLYHDPQVLPDRDFQTHSPSTLVVPPTDDADKSKTPSAQRGRRRTELVPELLAELLGHSDIILRITWDRSGTLLATGSVDRSVIIWNSETGGQLARLLGHSQGVNQAVWSPLGEGGVAVNGQYLATCSFDRTIRIWSTRDWNCIVEIQAHQNDIPDIAWSPNGNLLASASADERVSIWDPKTGQQISTWDDHKYYVYRVMWLDDNSLASSSWNGTVLIRNLVGGSSATVRTLRVGKQAQFGMDLAKSSDGHLLAVCAPDGGVQIWDWSAGRRVRILRSRNHGIARSATFSPDGQYVAANKPGRSGKVIVWRMEDGKQAAEFNEPTSAYFPPNIAWSPRQQVLATLGQRDQVVRLWDLHSSNRLAGARSFIIGPLSVSLSVTVPLIGHPKLGTAMVAIEVTNTSTIPVDVEFECRIRRQLIGVSVRRYLARYPSGHQGNEFR